MSRLIPSETGLLWILWLLPVILLFGQARFLRQEHPPIQGDLPPGYHWLAMPATRLDHPAWLSRWQELSVMDHHDPLQSAPLPESGTAAPVVSASAPSFEPFRIRLSGRIRDEQEDLYCLFDAKEKRWFRMSVGAVDVKAGVRLELDSVGGRPVMTDLTSGDRYRVKAGSTGLERIGSTSTPDGTTLQ